jgi:hypothetical protein
LPCDDVTTPKSQKRSPRQKTKGK